MFVFFHPFLQKNRMVTILSEVDVRPYDNHISSFDMFSPVHKNENITYIDNVKSQLIPIEIETMKQAGNEEKRRSLIFGSFEDEYENPTYVKTYTVLLILILLFILFFFKTGLMNSQNRLYG